MTVPKNVLLAAIAVITIALLSIVVYLLLKPKTAEPLAVSLGEKVAAPIATPTPTPATVAKQETFERQIKLTISGPVNGSIVKTNKVTIKGVTLPMAEVFVNDLELKADTLGNFSGTLTLEEGDNPISVTAIDEEGNYSETELIVTYEP